MENQDGVRVGGVVGSRAQNGPSIPYGNPAIFNRLFRITGVKFTEKAQGQTYNLPPIGGKSLRGLFTTFGKFAESHFTTLREE